MKKATKWGDLTDAQIEAVALAQCGLSLSVIASATDIQKGSLTYGLGLCKRADGLPKGLGYITQYRSGQSELAKSVIETALLDLKREARATLPQLLVAYRKRMAAARAGQANAKLMKGKAA